MNPRYIRDQKLFKVDTKFYFAVLNSHKRLGACFKTTCIFNPESKLFTIVKMYMNKSRFFAVAACFLFSDEWKGHTAVYADKLQPSDTRGMGRNEGMISEEPHTSDRNLLEINLAPAERVHSSSYTHANLDFSGNQDTTSATNVNKIRGRNPFISTDISGDRKLLGVIGDEYFREIASFGPDDLHSGGSYGDNVSLGRNGILAITGSGIVPNESSSENDNSDSALWRGYLEIHNLFTGLREAFIPSDDADYNPPAMDVAVSGDGSKVAFAEVHLDNGNAGTLTPISGVKVYKRSGTGTWAAVGIPINAGIAGELPGLRVSLSDSGNNLVIGSRNFNEGAGRTMVYELDAGTGNYVMKYDAVDGVSTNDHEGSSVSITSAGDYYATGSTGYEDPGDNGKSNQGGVRIYDVTTNQQIGSVILGEGQDDASGFATSLVKVDSTLVVAIGAIYNDPTPTQSNAGHVRVYKYTLGQDTAWQKLGSDLNGDNGVFIDFDNLEFHIGDRLGMALQLSEDGTRIVVGAPYYFGPEGNRVSEYYYGKVKLFQLQVPTGGESSSSDGDWIQIADDLVGAAKDSNSGHSLALNADGKTIVIGGPSETGGSVVIYYQDEISEQPSDLPTFVPSAVPTISLSSIPSSTPSSNPTEKASFEPSAVPTLAPTTSRPSATPSSEPTVTPSSPPSIFTSNTPSSAPSPVPTKRPSSEPSSKLTLAPSALPSFAPSSKPSSIPSLSPSSFSSRTFSITSTSSSYTDLPGNNNRSWCVQTTTRTSGAVLKVLPCSLALAHKQRWYVEDGKLKLRGTNEPGTFCVKDEGRDLTLQGCDSVTSYISFGDMDDDFVGPIVLSRNGREFYFGVSRAKIFSRVRLLTKQSLNSSKNSWKLEFVESSNMPSSPPSRLEPTRAPAGIPLALVHRPLNGLSPHDGFGYSAGISADGMRVVIGAPFRDINGVNSNVGQVMVFENTGSDWEPVHQPMNGLGRWHLFGRSVDIAADGSRIIVGGYDQVPGLVRVFKDDGSKWLQVHQNLLDGVEGGDLYGRSVGITANGLRIIIGAYRRDSNGIESGQVWVFEDDSSSWVPVHGGPLEGSVGDNFGYAVAITSNGKRIVAGAPNIGGNYSDKVRIFEDNGYTWAPVHQDLDGFHGNFGSAVAIAENGKRVVIGALNNSLIKRSSGEVRVFDDDGSSWIQVHQSFNGVGINFNLGYAVDISADGSRVVMAELGGRARMYNDDGSTWVPAHMDELSTHSRSIGISGDGDRIVIGVNSINDHTGQVKIFIG